ISRHAYGAVSTAWDLLPKHGVIVHRGRVPPKRPSDPVCRPSQLRAPVWALRSTRAHADAAGGDGKSATSWSSRRNVVRLALVPVNARPHRSRTTPHLTGGSRGRRNQ